MVTNVRMGRSPRVAHKGFIISDSSSRRWFFLFARACWSKIIEEERRRADVWFTLFNRRLNVDYKVNLTSNRIDWRLFFLLPSPSVHPKRSLEILVLLIRFAYATKIYEPKVKYEDVSHHSIEDWRPTIINDHQPKVGNNGWAGGWVLMSWVSN